MPIPVLMPALSPTMTEGTLAKWLKAEGDAISAGDIIAEIETDKATMEIESTEDGTLGRIVVPAGTEGVSVNSVIAQILEEGEDRASLDTPALDTPTLDTVPAPPAPGQATGEPGAQAAVAPTAAVVADPEPALEPPVNRSRSHGLRLGL